MREIVVDNIDEKSLKAGLPESIAIVMDGNGRWAQKRGLKREAGHEQGSKVAEDIVSYAQELGIKFVTLYAFSTENWRRPKNEIDAIMKILGNYLKQNTKELLERGVKINAVGELWRLPLHLKKALQKVIEETKSGQKMVITLALSYGSWSEVSSACYEICRQVLNKEISIENINEDLLSKNLLLNDIPNPDLFIRTSGEMRLSNFLLLQSSYAELYFTNTMWPDFKRTDFDKALAAFKARKRRFGCESSL